MEATNTMDITIRVASNADNNTIAAALRMRAGLFEGMPVKEAASRKNTTAAVTAEVVEEPEVVEDEDGFTPPAKKKTAAKKANVDFEEESTEEESFEEESTEEESFEEEAPKAKAKKAKPLTKDDVVAACKEHARRHSFDDTKAILVKKFGTSSASKLKEEQYADVIAAVKG